MTSIPNDRAEENGGPAEAEGARATDRTEPLLTLTLDSEAVHLQPAELRNNDFREELLERCERADQVLVDLRDLPAWQDPDRQQVIRFVGDLLQHPGLEITVGENSAQQTNLFEAVKSLLCRSDDVTRSQRILDGTLEAAAVSFPNETALRFACGQVADRLRELGIRDVRVSRLVTQALAFQNTAVPEAEEAAGLLRGVWPDAPCPEETHIPDGWLLDEEGVMEAGQSDSPRLPARMARRRASAQR